jgi:hypothetical protein
MGEVGAGAGAELEEHGFAVGEAHDGFHVVVDGLDEAGAALGIDRIGRGAFDGGFLRVVIPVAEGGVVADAVLVVEADVEPDRGIEGAVLVQAQPGQFIVKISPSALSK